MSNNTVRNNFQPIGRVKIIEGSILTPQNAGLRFVLNVNNTIGKAEGPLYPIFDKKWKKVKEEAKGWYNTRTGAYKLGAIKTTAVQSDVWVIHMICQDDKFETDIKSLTTCLKEVCKLAKYEKSTIHVSNLIVEMIPEIIPLLEELVVNEGVNVSFYTEKTDEKNSVQ